MGPSPLPTLLLLLPALALGPRAPLAAPGSARAAPLNAWSPEPLRAVLRQLCAAAAPLLLQACGSHPEGRAAWPGSEPSWIWAYIPMRSCHRILRDKHGQFSPPAYRGSSPMSFWCNWTIWAGSRRHILVYIQGFTAGEDCNANEDKILFEGVSSLVEDSVVYACWKRDTHVFATFAEAVHVVLLKTYLPRCRDVWFQGTYYIFGHEEAGLSSGEHLASGSPAPKPPARDPVVEAGQKDIPEDLGQAQGFSSPPPETPLLGALQGEEPSLRPLSTDLENRRPFLQPMDPGDPRLDIKPTHTRGRDPALPPQDSSPGGEEDVDPASSLGLGAIGLEDTEGCSLWSSAADEAWSLPAGSLLPSLALPREVLGQDRSLLLPRRSFAEPWPRTKPMLRTSALQPTTLMDFPALGSFGDASKVEELQHPAGSWSVPKGQPQPSTRSSCTLQAAPADPRSTDPHSGCVPHVSVVQGHALLGAASTMCMERTLVPVCPETDPACAGLGSTGLTLVEEPVEQSVLEPSAVSTMNAEGRTGPPAQELGGPTEGMEPPGPSAPHSAAGTGTLAACSPQQEGPLVGPGVRELVLDDGDGAERRWRGQAAAPTDRDLQQLPDLLLGKGLPPAEDMEAPWLPSVPVSLPPSPAPQGPQTPGGGQHHKHTELGPPWAMEYFPVRSCHVVLQGEFGSFYPLLRSDIHTNVWCNWTIWAGPQKHILIYIQGFHTQEGCDKNQDKMIFQGVLSSVETKVVHACYNRGTVIFATQASAVHVLLLSGADSLGNKYQHFKGRYYVFRDYGAVGSADTMPAPARDVSKVDISRGVSQPHGPQEGTPGGEFSLLEGEMELERSLRDGKTEGRGDGEGVLVEAAAAGGDTGRNTKLTALDVMEGAAWLEPTWVPTAMGGPTTMDVPLEAPKSSARPSAARIPPSLAPTHSALWVGITTVTRSFPMQMSAMEEPPLHTNVKASPLYPFVGMTAGATAMTGHSQEDLFDLASVLASLENDTVLRSQHHPGDVLFEVTVEIKHMDWVPRGGRELNKDLLESMKSHIQKNLKLSANKVNEIKLKEIRRAGRENLLLTFWLHLRPEERNLSVALRSQLQELLGQPRVAERPRLVSLVVEDVDECGLGLCGEAAHCFNGVGTYLCRCKEGYEDRSPTKAGTLCVPMPRSGLLHFLQQPEVLAGAALSVGLLLPVAVLALRRARRQRCSVGNPFPEERGARPEPVEQVVMELSRLEQCLQLEPFQLKVRARPPEWVSQAHGGPACGHLPQHEERL